METAEAVVLSLDGRDKRLKLGVNGELASAVGLD